MRFGVGDGDEQIVMQSGSYRVVEGETAWTPLSVGRPNGSEIIYSWPLETAEGDPAGEVEIATMSGGLSIVVRASAGNRTRLDAACTGDDHFAGFGQHAMDVDHVGRAFPLWVSEPGIGKSESESPGADWYLTGTRHASSYPDPFFIRPEPFGLEVMTGGRVEVDLCTGDRWRVDVWSTGAQFDLLDEDTPIDVVRARSTRYGRIESPPDWAFAPWNDAVGGVERVLEVAAALRGAGAPSSVIWTEDWKGAEQTAWGYHLTPEWTLDETLYPDASGVAEALEQQGFKWFAYFSPFVVVDTEAWAEAEDLLIRTEAGAPYTFTGVTFEDTSVLDLSREDARAWAAEKMQAIVDVGFDGWMADYAEWLPADAMLASTDAESVHNLYPLWWQQVNAEVLGDQDAAFFTRSGWAGSPTISPIGWAGDQRTSFDTDDGYPSVIPMSLGAGISGLLMYGSDIAGYQSIGNEPSTKELWFRWCTLGAFSPVMRTHHGAFKDDNWQFDSDAETLAHFARYGQVHTALFPYLKSLATSGATDGTPLLLAPFLLDPTQDWNRMDAWFLGPSLFVAPILVEGATSREVDLPAASGWYDWWSGTPVTDGTFAADIGEIPVFAPAGAIVPLLAEPPDSLVPGPVEGITTLAEADTMRVVRVFAGAAGHFTEADGTDYATDGVATGPGTATATISSGSISAGGLTLTIQGSTERTYTLEVAR